MDGTNGFTAVKQFTTPCNFCKRNQLVCCASTTGKSAKCEACRAYGYEHPIARTPNEDMDSGVSSKAPSGKNRLMVGVSIPSERIVRAPRTSGGLAGISQAGSHE
ncbi:hypothetical protein BY996DRAFT_6412963 [Phakopsora pachyrhizi]|nr:hypothetical protein BY996DRAFT_6412963 [Phakopsora pachyrhizi]